MELPFEPEKWFAGLFKGGVGRRKNALPGLDKNEQLGLAGLLHAMVKGRSLIRTGHVGPATKFREMVVTAKKLRDQQKDEGVRMLCETASPFQSTFRELLDQAIASYTDPDFESGLAKPNQDATTTTNILLLAACRFVIDRLGKPHYDDLAELIMLIDPNAKDFSADAIRVRTKQFEKSHPQEAKTANRWFPAKAAQEQDKTPGKSQSARASKGTCRGKRSSEAAGGGELA